MSRKRSFPFMPVFSALLFAAILFISVSGLKSAEKARGSEALRALEDSLNRAAASCYAVEGMYPDTLEYLTGNYGIYVDGSKYTVHYEIFASNIMPDITVTEK